MKKIDKKYIIVGAIVLLIIICLVVFIIMGNTSKNKNNKNETKVEEWLLKEYDFEDSRGALEEIKKHDEFVELEKESARGCWLYKTKDTSIVYRYCKDTKMIVKMHVVDFDEEEEE